MLDLNNYSDKQIEELYEKMESLKNLKETNLYAYRDWEYYKKQKEIRKYCFNRIRKGQGASIIAVFGGNRSSKSETMASVIVDVLINDYNKKIWCATESDISIKVQQTKIAQLVPKDIIYYGDFNSSRGWKNNMLTTHKSTSCYFKTYSQERKSFQGEDLDICWLDEEAPFDIFQEVLARLIDRNGTLLISFTSLMGFTRLVNYLYDENNERIKLFTMSMLENPFLPKEAVEEFLVTCDPDDVDSRVHGKPKMKQGLIYKEFNEDHIITPFNYVEEWKNNKSRYEIFEGIDPHVRTPHHWLRFLYDKKNDILYVVDELKAPREALKIADMASLIKMKRKYKHTQINPKYTIIDTSSMTPLPMHGYDEKPEEDFTIRTEFAKSGIYTILPKKDNAIGISAVKGRLTQFEGADGKKHSKIYVFSTCTGVIFEFRRYTWKNRGVRQVEEKGETNEVKKVNDHYMDIIKYECINKSFGNMSADHIQGNEGDQYRVL